MKLKTKKSKLKTIGIEMPFGWCLIKGSELRKLQTDLREAQNKVAIRSRWIADLYRSIYNKGSR